MLPFGICEYGESDMKGKASCWKGTAYLACSYRVCYASLSIIQTSWLQILIYWLVDRGCYFQEGKEVKMDMRVEDAYHRSIETVVDYIHTKLNTNKTQVFFRTFAPVHFRFVSQLIFSFNVVALHLVKPGWHKLLISMNFQFLEQRWVVELHEYPMELN